MKSSTKRSPSTKSQQKICIVCERPFSNRKRWASRGIWEEVKYCSDLCRKNKQQK